MAEIVSLRRLQELPIAGPWILIERSGGPRFYIWVKPQEGVDYDSSVDGPVDDFEEALALAQRRASQYGIALIYVLRQPDR